MNNQELERQLQELRRQEEELEQNYRRERDLIRQRISNIISQIHGL